MKKLFSILLAVSMLLTLMVGCNNGGGDTQPNIVKPTDYVKNENTLHELTFPLTTEDITITGVVVGPLGENMESRELWDLITELTGIKIEWIVLDSESVATFLSGTEHWDFWYNPFSSELVLDMGVDGGKLVDFNKYLDYMPNLRKAIEDYPSAQKICTETNGAMYGLPRIAEEVTTAQNRAYYNVELVQKAGWDPADIKTVDDLYECMKDVKELTGHAPLTNYQHSETSSFVSTIYMAFGEEVQADFVDDGTGKVVYNRISEQYRLYLQYMNKLYEEGLIYSEFPSCDAATAKGFAFEGKSAFWCGEANSMTEEYFESGKVELSILDPLTSEYDSTQTYYTNHTVKYGGGHINVESEHIELICQMLDIAFAEDEVAEGSGLAGVSFWYGIYGENCVVNEDGTWEQKVPEGFEGSFSDWTNKDWNWGVVSFGRDTVLGEAVTATPGNGQARQIAMRDHVKPWEVDYDEHIFPDTLLKYTADELLERTGPMADVQAYIEEMEVKFVTGVADIDTEWDAYVQGVYDRGLEDIIEITQAAYDRWCAIE